MKETSEPMERCARATPSLAIISEGQEHEIQVDADRVVASRSMRWPVFSFFTHQGFSY